MAVLIDARRLLEALYMPCPEDFPPPAGCNLRSVLTSWAQPLRYNHPDLRCELCSVSILKGLACNDRVKASPNHWKTALRHTLRHYCPKIQLVLSPVLHLALLRFRKLCRHTNYHHHCRPQRLNHPRQKSLLQKIRRYQQYPPNIDWSFHPQSRSTRCLYLYWKNTLRQHCFFPSILLIPFWP